MQGTEEPLGGACFCLDNVFAFCNNIASSTLGQFLIADSSLIVLMAEVVELRLERGVNELLQLVRVNLFTADEVKTIIKKRRSFEYKLQRHGKSKDDYLRYISYEECLLKLIKLRRRKIGYNHKIKEIDLTIANRIGAIFRAVIFRHQSDVQLWLSYIEFCKRMKWKGKVGSLFTKMLQIHNRKDHLWVAAAKFEFEDNNSSTVARSLIQRGLRYNKDSQVLWKEYFKFELLYAEKIGKRKELIQRDDVQVVDLPTDNKEENDGDLDNDAILSGKVALIVCQSAAEQVKEKKFFESLVSVLKDFDLSFVDWLEEQINNLIATVTIPINVNK